MTRRSQTEPPFDSMREAYREIEPEEQYAEPATADDPYAGPADPFTQRDGYFPPGGDQSWRELEALHFAPGSETRFGEAAADAAFIEPEPLSESESGGPGWKGVLLALLIVPVAGFAIVALTAPGILTAKFWRVQARAENPPAKPAAMSAAPANVPSPAPLARSAAPAQLRKPKPDLDMTPPPDITANAAPTLNSVADATPDANMRSDVDANSDVASKPSPKPAARRARRSRSGGRARNGFYAKVIQPDGSFRTEYFPSKPGSGSRLAMRDIGRKEADVGGESGFHTMVIRPDGSLEYRYFSARPSR